MPRVLNRHGVGGYDMKRFTLVALIAALGTLVVPSVVAAQLADGSDEGGGGSGGGGETSEPSPPQMVFFVHGLEEDSGVSCNDKWAHLIRTFGWPGRMAVAHPVRYYVGDDPCDPQRTDIGTYVSIGDIDINGYGDHSRHHGAGGHRAGTHTTDASIRHLAYHLAWAMHSFDHGHPDAEIDVVGHSMGGLIIRYAIMKVQQGDPDFPHAIVADDVVTLGTPHDGSGFARVCRPYPWEVPDPQQCDEMQPSSDFLNELDRSGRNPQASGGTDWTVVGANDDNWVDWGSAVHMDANHKVQYHGGQGIEHDSYMQEQASSFEKRGKISDWGSDWREVSWLPWPVRVTLNATDYDSW